MNSHREKHLNFYNFVKWKKLINLACQPFQSHTHEVSFSSCCSSVKWWRHCRWCILYWHPKPFYFKFFTLLLCVCCLLVCLYMTNRQKILTWNCHKRIEKNIRKEAASIAFLRLIWRNDYCDDRNLSKWICKLSAVECMQVTNLWDKEVI